MTTPNTKPMGGLHRTDLLSKPQTDIIATWSRQLNRKEPPSNNKWILKQHKEIFDTIINRTVKPYSDNSRKTHLSVLAKVIRLETGNKLDNPLFLKYSTLSTELGKKDEKKREEQLLSDEEKKRWMSFKEIQTIVENNHSKMFDGNISDMYNGLIACLYFYIPPIRVDYGDIHIWKKKSKLPDDKLNYMVKENGLWIFELREYKTFAKYGVAKIKTTKDLTKLIDETLTEYPRKYLLTSVLDINKSLGTSGLQKSITNIFGIGISLIRKIYGSHFYKIWNGRKSKMLELGKKMLHSSSTFYDHYLRFTDEEIAEQDAPESSRQAQERKTTREIATQTETATKTIETQTDKKRILGDIPFTPVEYSKAYKKAHKENTKKNNQKYFQAHKDDILRAKLVRNLNRGHTSSPTQASITKYRLRKVEGKWV